MQNNQIFLELAARAPIEVYQHEDSTRGYPARVYRFDMRHVYGDYILESIALPFASEEAARAALFVNLLKTFG